MSSNCRFLLAACAVPLTLVACGGSDSDGIEQQPVPEGTHYGYVVSSVSIPAGNAQVQQYGLDLGSKTSAKPDQVVDNVLGQALSTLGGPPLNFKVQDTVTSAVNTGSLILLVDFQTKEFGAATASGLSVKFGATPSPAPCTNPTDETTCGQHLKGNGTFSIATDSPEDALVSGKIVSGAFSGGPGDVSLAIAIGSTTPITLTLVHARARATGITENGITSLIVGGLVTQEQLLTKLGPAIHDSVVPLIDRDCPAGAGRVPPGCGCTLNSTGATVVSLADTSPADCNVTTEELLNAPVVKQLLTPDSCSQASCAKPDSLSIGVKVTAAKASFPLGD